MTRPITQVPAIVTAIVAVIFAGAIFGFFVAWSCSTLLGLDHADPRTAIEAMNAMNASVRNPAFFTVFFGTPLALLLAAVFAWIARARRAAVLLLAAMVLYGVGSILFTQAFHLPLNEGLATGGVPSEEAEATAVWAEYSNAWQADNLIRTVATGICLALSGTATLFLGHSLSRRAPGDRAELTVSRLGPA